MADIRKALVPQPARRSSPLSMDEWVSYFTFGGNGYTVPMFNTTLQGSRETIDDSFTGYVQQVYRQNGVVFAVEAVRVRLFSEARFQFRELEQGRPGKLFGGTDGRNPSNRTLRLLENPWPGATTSDLLARSLLHADFAGTAFVCRRPTGLRLARPDWVTVVAGSPNPDVDLDATDLDAEVIGYIYHPGGRYSGRKPVTMLANTVAPFAPMPDPTGLVRGVPWMAPVIREIAGDQAMTSHKLQYFENAATPNLAVTLDADITLADAKEWIELFRQDHEGAFNAFKTLFLGGGAKPVPVGSDLRNMDFKSVQGAAETRIAAAGGVPPIIVGLSEGLASATYSNYGQARRALADVMLRPTWRKFVNAVGSILDEPEGSELWYDDRDIPFLQEDVKDEADIQSVRAGSVGALITQGFNPDDVLDAVLANDLARLRGKHSGFYSVQLQELGTEPAQLQTTKPEQPLLTAGNPQRSVEVRCDRGHLLAELATPPYRFTCGKCKTIHESGEIRSVEVRDSYLERRMDDLERDFARREPIAVNITTPPTVISERAISLTAPPVSIGEGAIHVSVPDVVIPPIQVDNHFEPAVVNVTTPAVTVEPQPVNVEAPVVNVTVPESKPTKKRIERDADGRPSALIEEPVDGE